MNTITWLWWLNSWRWRKALFTSVINDLCFAWSLQRDFHLFRWMNPTTPVCHPPSWAKCPAQLNDVPKTWLSSSFSLMKWVVPPQFLIKCNQLMNDFGKLEWSVCQGALWANSPGKREKNKGWKYSSILITGGFLL